MDARVLSAPPDRAMSTHDNLTKCRFCGSKNVRYSNRTTKSDGMEHLFLRRAFRCLDCRHRFYDFKWRQPSAFDSAFRLARERHSRSKAALPAEEALAEVSAAEGLGESFPEFETGPGAEGGRASPGVALGPSNAETDLGLGAEQGLKPGRARMRAYAEAAEARRETAAMAEAAKQAVEAARAAQQEAREAANLARATLETELAARARIEARIAREATAQVEAEKQAAQAAGRGREEAEQKSAREAATQAEAE